jgi:hypothetical protein
MDIRQLTGYYTYRSFLNNPIPVGDFNQIKFAEAELFINVQTDGTITGTLSFPAQSAQAEKLFMDITVGSVKILQDKFNFEFTAQGRPDTEIFDYLYNYYGSVTHTWENGINQRLSLAGTVLRAQDHGSSDHIEQAGVTASFIAVQRDFVEPRDIHEVAIIPSALEMVSSKSHRLIHAVWHTLRGRIELLPQNSNKFVYTWYILDEESKNKIRELGWYLERPPFTKPNRPTERGSLNLGNGAGEDFLFMHRKMITMIRLEYESKGVPYFQSWKTPSLPLPNIPQFVYSEKNDPTNPGKKIFQFNALESGNMVPLPSFDPKDERNNIIDFTKSSEFFYNVMSSMAKIFSNPAVLGTLSLGALGNLIEFTIHGWMHNRWANDNGALLPDPKDPKTKKYRDTFDFDPMWDDPKYDYLGEFYSSHVNPLFWRLHGWVDDRIEDWFNAHESMQPGEIERQHYNGVSWFKPGKWVQVEKPFYWPEDMHHHLHDLHNNHEDNEQKPVENILKVMNIIKAARDAFVTPQSELSEVTMEVTKTKTTSVPGGSMNFIHTIDIEK